MGYAFENIWNELMQNQSKVKNANSGTAEL